MTRHRARQRIHDRWEREREEQEALAAQVEEDTCEKHRVFCCDECFDQRLTTENDHDC